MLDALGDGPLTIIRMEMRGPEANLIPILNRVPKPSYRLLTYIGELTVF